MTEALTQAAQDVIAERRRQIEVEGWFVEHDDAERVNGELARAAACYALIDTGRLLYDDYMRYWPWDKSWWKIKSHRHNLVRAGALILAEIERLDRQGNAP